MMDAPRRAESCWVRKKNGRMKLSGGYDLMPESA